MGTNAPTAPSAGTDYIAQCGKHYARFVDAVNDEGSITGWSLYDFQTTGPRGWAALKNIES